MELNEFIKGTPADQGNGRVYGLGSGYGCGIGSGSGDCRESINGTRDGSGYGAGYCE